MSYFRELEEDVKYNGNFGYGELIVLGVL